MHLALGRVERASQFRRSRARGVAKTRNVIPMLGGKHYFLWSPCSVGVRISFFSTPLRWEWSKNCFSENFQMIYLLFDCLLRTGAAWRCPFLRWLAKNASGPAWGSYFCIRIFDAAKHIVFWQPSQASTNSLLRGAYCVFLTCAKFCVCMDLHAVAGNEPQHQQNDTT